MSIGPDEDDFLMGMAFWDSMNEEDDSGELGCGSLIGVIMIAAIIIEAVVNGVKKFFLNMAHPRLFIIAVVLIILVLVAIGMGWLSGKALHRLKRKSLKYWRKIESAKFVSDFLSFIDEFLSKDARN